jgi:hypothetical protein
MKCQIPLDTFSLLPVGQGGSRIHLTARPPSVTEAPAKIQAANVFPKFTCQLFGGETSTQMAQEPEDHIQEC